MFKELAESIRLLVERKDPPSRTQTTGHVFTRNEQKENDRLPPYSSPSSSDISSSLCGLLIQAMNSLAHSSRAFT
jgi:hypothetical protein